MNKSLLTFMAASVAAVTLVPSVSAQGVKDVTADYIKNAGFESEKMAVSNSGSVTDITGWVSTTTAGTSYNNHQVCDAATANAFNASAATNHQSVSVADVKLLADVPFEVATVTPATDTEMANVQDFSVTFTGEAGYVIYQIVDNNPDDVNEAVLTSSYLTKAEDGSFTTNGLMKHLVDDLECDLNMYAGHTYTLKVTAYETEDDYNYDLESLGTFDAATWKGTTKDYQYAAAKFVSVTPENDSQLETVNDNQIVVTFDAPVVVDKNLTGIVTGVMTNEQFESITSNEDGTVWTLTIPESLMAANKTSFEIALVATDAEGNRVKGNAGIKSESFFSWSYICNIGAPDFTVTPAEGSTVEAIDKITMAFNQGIFFSYVCSEPIALEKVAEDGTTTLVKNFTDEDLTYTEGKVGGDDGFVAANIELAEPITEAGNYRLTVPNFFFSLASQFDGCNSKKTVVNFTVAGSALTASLVSPEDGIEMANLQDFTFKFNDEDVNVVMYKVIDNNPDDASQAVIKTNVLTKNADGEFTTGTSIADIVAYNAENYKMYEGRTYSLVVTAYADFPSFSSKDAMGEFTIATWKGTRADYQYAAAKLVSITPENKSELKTIEDNEIVATFDQPVEVSAETTYLVTGPKAHQAFESITSNEDKTVWTLVIPQSMLKTATTGIQVALVATDAEGHRVKGTHGQKAESFFSLSYDCNIGAPDLEVTPAQDDEVESLSEITIGCEKGLMFSAATSEKIQLAKVNMIDKDWEVIAEFGANDITYNLDENAEASDADVPTLATIQLAEAIAEDGTYQIVIPSSFFSLGTQYDGCNSKETVVTFYVKGNAVSDIVLDVNPIAMTVNGNEYVEGNTVESIKTVSVTFENLEDDILCPSYEKYPTVIDAEGQVVSECDAIDSWDGPFYDITLKTPISTPGVYTLVIPAESFGDMAWGESMYQRGHANPECRLTIVVGGPTAITAITADGAVDVYSVNGTLVKKNATADDLKELKGIFIIKNQKVMLK